MMIHICIIQVMAYIIGTGSLIIFASIKATYFAQCYHFLIDILISKGIGNINGILVPLACILSNKKLRKFCFEYLARIFKRVCPEKACEDEPDEIDRMLETAPSDEGDQRMLDLEASWDKAFEMRSICK